MMVIWAHRLIIMKMMLSRRIQIKDREEQSPDNLTTAKRAPPQKSTCKYKASQSPIDKAAELRSLKIKKVTILKKNGELNPKMQKRPKSKKRKTTQITNRISKAFQ